MILPERVFGRPGANWMRSGEAIGPISFRTQATSSLRSPSDARLAGHQRHVGVDALALDVVRVADDRRLRDLGVGDERDSTSAVPMRWPETLMTSSTRPVIQ